MVPHSQNVAYSDGDSRVLWKDSERVCFTGAGDSTMRASGGPCCRTRIY